MINKLTKEQEAQLNIYRDKWLKIGLSTKQIDFNKSLEIKNILYSKLLNKKNVPVILMDSPITAWLATFYLGSMFYGKQVGSQVWSQVGSFLWPYFGGHFDVSYFSFYEFMFECLGIKNPVSELFESYIKTTETGIIYPCDDFCVISNRPTNINMKNGLLHSDGSPAVEYADGLKSWALNGVKVPQYLAETPEGELSIDFFKKENNADIRAEFIRKFGIERM